MKAAKEPQQVHGLKIWPEYFHAVVAGGKRFEVRRNDREFRVGDTLVLREWHPLEQKYTGHSCACTITYILPGGQHGIADGFAVLGFKFAKTHGKEGNLV